MNELLKKMTSSVVKNVSKAKFQINKRSPEILLTCGLVAFAGTVVMACRATLKAEEVIDRHNEKLQNIEDAKEISVENPEEYDYDEQLYKRDKTVCYVQTVVELGKLYAPSIGLAVLSVTCFVTSRNILHKRYLGVVAAYNAVSEAFKTYRQRVIDEVGEQMDRHYRYGTKLEEITNKIVDEKGKEKEIKETVENIDSSSLPTDFARFFDEGNPNWDTNPNYNLMFLRAQQNIANDILHSKGFIMLSEVYDMLGFEQTPESLVTGWVEGLGDNCVDFGLYDYEKEGVRKFVNGKANVILLDFNHDGVVWDKLPRK